MHLTANEKALILAEAFTILLNFSINNSMMLK